MSSMDVFVTFVQQNSAPKNFERLHDYVKNNSHMLQKHISHLDTVLGILDMHEHSIGWLAVLVAKFSMPNNPDFEALFSKVRDFVRACNEVQIREASDLFATLCHRLRSALIERKQALRGIVVLKEAITKMQNNVLQLTSVHSDLCLLCLEAKCYKPALTVLDLDMTDICKEKGVYEGKDFINHYYYGGSIYTNVKNYERALYFYEQVITIPALSVHPIMEHAFKRYILVSLILHGKMQPLPKYTAQIIGRIKPSSSVYYEFAQVYTSNNHAELRGLVSKQGEMFKRDDTTDLVKQCLDSLNKKNIQRLTKTFLTLSLQDMASRVQLSGPQEAEKYVLNMIEDGEIYATINQKDGMVCFHDNPEKYNNPAMLHKIDQEMSKCKELDRTLKFFDQIITTSEQFVRKSMGPPEEDAWLR